MALLIATWGIVVEYGSADGYLTIILEYGSADRYLTIILEYGSADRYLGHCCRVWLC